MRIIPTTIEKLKKIRTDYLNSLPEFQELYIELMIQHANCYLLQVDNNDAGYAIVNSDGALIEFYVENKYISVNNAIFNQLINELSITDIYCKSFDFLLLSNCLLNTYSYSLMGVLYREYVETGLTKDLAINMQKADLTSVNFLLRQDDSIKELFETKQQITDFITNENVFLFYRENEFAGCGMVLKTNADWDYCDLGVWVTPDKRGKSIGTQILLHLREFALIHNLKPSCGCAIDNIASQKTIEKSGFVSKHKLINFKVAK